MKISQKKKQENREAIIRAAVDLIIDKGFKAATMRAIARQAGLGDATIYNYFPTKESILYAYYQDKFVEAAQKLGELPSIEEFSFQERLQALFEICLEGYLGDREFLQETFKMVFSPITNSGELKPIQAGFLECLDGIFDQAVADGEIEDPPFRELTYHFFWDYYIGVVFCWLRDRSEHFTDTSELVNKTLDLGCAVLKAGVVNKAFDILSFLFRNHIVSRLQTFKPGLDVINEVRRAFREDRSERADTGK